VYSRTSLVDVIFEIFVRSSNHAHSKKVNSLILFSINLNETKETQKNVWNPFLKCYTMYGYNIRIIHRLKEISESNQSSNELMKSTINNTSMKNVKKSRNADLEFRDGGNSWIEATMEDIEHKKKVERSEPNMV
jgi:hypothetical protein